MIWDGNDRAKEEEADAAKRYQKNIETASG